MGFGVERFEGRLSAATILLLEDEASVGRGVSRLLQRGGGYTVLWARDAAAAIACARDRSEDFDLLISDVALPDMSGPDAAQQVAEIRRGVGVLYISGHSAEDLFERGLLPPDAPVLSKPFEMEQLLARVEEAIR